MDSSQCKVDDITFALQIRSNEQPDNELDQARSLWIVQDNYVLEVQLGINATGTDGLLFYASQSHNNFTSLCDKTTATKASESNVLIAFSRVGGASAPNTLGVFAYDFKEQRVVYIAPTIGNAPHKESDHLVEGINTNSVSGLSFAVDGGTTDIPNCGDFCNKITPAGQSASGAVDDTKQLVWWTSVINDRDYYHASPTEEDFNRTWLYNKMNQFFATSKEFKDAFQYNPIKGSFGINDYHHTTLSNGIECIYIIDPATYTDLPKDNSNDWQCQAKK